MQGEYYESGNGLPRQDIARVVDAEDHPAHADQQAKSNQRDRQLGKGDSIAQSDRQA